LDLKPPGFSPSQWFNYLTNVVALAPIRKDEPITGVPEVRGCSLPPNAHHDVILYRGT
jgi:hypothetical protein